MFFRRYLIGFAAGLIVFALSAAAIVWVLYSIA